LYKEFLRFIEQIYPVEEEREIIQRYFGYCLLGDHREKQFLILTDKRKGFNGKSTVTKLLMKALGDYAMKGNNSFLYKTDARHESVNSHSAGMLAYMNYRLAIFEETDSKERLDDQRLKDTNGGNTQIKGRHINSKEMETFTWGCKMILLCNDNNFPQFDFTDTAMLDRMLIVIHRARFFQDVDDYEKHKDEQYTYLATSEIDAKLDLWRPCLLKWALEGLGNYWTKRFEQVPQSCKKWKAGLLSEQDEVEPFLKENTTDGAVSGNEKVWVGGKNLYERYKNSCPAEKDKKTKLGYKKFMQRVFTVWSEVAYYEEKRINCKLYYSVFMGKSFIE